jgi:hypothetical protein
VIKTIFESLLFLSLSHIIEKNIIISKGHAKNENGPCWGNVVF